MKAAYGVMAILALGALSPAAGWSAAAAKRAAVSRAHEAPHGSDAAVQRGRPAVPQRGSAHAPQGGSAAAPQSGGSAAPQGSSAAAPQGASAAAPQATSNTSNATSVGGNARGGAVVAASSTGNGRSMIVAPTGARPAAALSHSTPKIAGTQRLTGVPGDAVARHVPFNAVLGGKATYDAKILVRR